MDDNRPGGAEDGGGDHRYFGPFGAPSPDSPEQSSSAGHGQPGGPGHADSAEAATEVHPAGAGWPAPDDYWPAHAAAQPGAGHQRGTTLGPDPLTGGGGGGLGGPSAVAFPPPESRSQARTRRGLRAAAVIAIAAVTALLVGGGAGYGGALLVNRPARDAVTRSSAPTTERAPTAPAAAFDTVEIARRVLPGTVMIEVAGATGSGFVLDREGRIMTNNHVIAGAADGGRIRVVFSDGSRQNATLVGRSPSYDIAVIKVRSSDSLKPIAVGDSDQSQVGEPVIAVGSPLGLGGTVTQGIVSAQNRPVVVSADSDADAPTAYIDAIQTDAPINPGNSGGPLIDGRAQVIGVNSAILTLGSTRGQSGSIGLGFAIPINQASVIGKQLISDGKATYPVIGATVNTASGGVELVSVEADGPASDAGLRAGDVINQIDGREVETLEELIVAVRTHRPGDVVTLDYTRASSKGRASVTLGSKEG